MTNDELVKTVQDLQRRLGEAEQYIRERKITQLSYPVDDISRMNLGMGVVGEDLTATTPTRSVLVNTNQGQLKVIVAN